MKPHRTDNVSLSFGVIFLLIAGWWAASRVVDLAPVRLGWLIAGALIVFGMIGLLGAIRSGRRPEPIAATVGAPVEERQHGDLPPEMHAEIVRELLDDPADRFGRENPAGVPFRAPAPAPSPAASWPSPPVSSPPSSAAPSPSPAASSAPSPAPAARDEPVTRVEPALGAEPDKD